MRFVTMEQDQSFTLGEGGGRGKGGSILRPKDTMAVFAMRLCTRTLLHKGTETHITPDYERGQNS